MERQTPGELGEESRVQETSPPTSHYMISPGFELFLPPTPFAQLPKHPGRFVMFDDENDIFYDVDYCSATLRNSISWSDLALHRMDDVAIIFPPAQWEKLVQNAEWLPTGFLVSVRTRSPEHFEAVMLGAVHVKQLSQELMNWDALESEKGSELPAELKAGLLRKVFNRRTGAAQQSSFVNPRRVLDKMTRQWHRDGGWLNWELDHRFVGGRRLEEGQKWKLCAS